MTQEDKEMIDRIIEIIEGAEIDWSAEFSAEKIWLEKVKKKGYDTGRKRP